MKIIIFLILIGMFGCISNDKAESVTPKERFKIGEVAYLKPDSLKCTIYYFGGNHWNPHYAVRYTDINGVIINSGTGWIHSLISESSFY